MRIPKEVVFSQNSLKSVDVALFEDDKLQYRDQPGDGKGSSQKHHLLDTAREQKMEFAAWRTQQEITQNLQTLAHPHCLQSAESQPHPLYPARDRAIGVLLTLGETLLTTELY